jgi:small neutral amino acid transporter SnatA (MarC family)
MTDEFFQAASLLLVVLNPFALSVYLVDIIRNRSRAEFLGILLRACLISGAVFGVFACFGASVFTRVLHIRFEAFQVFGGILFLLLALRFMLLGSQTLVTLRGEPGHVAGAVALPFMIGPGTISAATVAGLKQPPLLALLSIACALLATVAVLWLLKTIFDHVQQRRAGLVERYIEIASRISAMLVGSIAIEMIFSGLGAFTHARLG